MRHYRQYGLQLFKDERRLRVRTLFGSLTDPAFVSERPDAAAADLLGRVAFLWAGAVLHVRASRPCLHHFLLRSSAHYCIACPLVNYEPEPGAQQMFQFVGLRPWFACFVGRAF